MLSHPPDPILSHATPDLHSSYILSQQQISSIEQVFTKYQVHIGLEVQKGREKSPCRQRALDMSLQEWMRPSGGQRRGRAEETA